MTTTKMPIATLPLPNGKNVAPKKDAVKPKGMAGSKDVEKLNKEQAQKKKYDEKKKYDQAKKK
jgi:hypothetical protein